VSRPAGYHHTEETKRRIMETKIASGSKAPRIQKTCDYCGTAIVRLVSHLRGDRIFCDHNCQHAFQIGDHACAWKGGNSKKHRLHRKWWPELIRKRAGKQCEICGNKRRLHAHHLFSYRDHPDQRNDPNNGICLCVKCHQKVHRGELVPQRRMTI
jgi:hypothetical protein